MTSTYSGIGPAGKKEKPHMQTAPRLPNRLPPLTMQKIAREHRAGCNVKEIATEHGITVHAVLAISRRVDVQRVHARNLSRAGRPRQAVPAPSIVPPEPNRQVGGYYVIHRDGMAISLPMLSILRGAALSEEGE